MPYAKGMDLNADAGESFGHWPLGNDEALFPLLTSVNLALGFHAGDPLTLHAAVKRAAQHGLGIGAHPGYPDLVGFGRRAMALSAADIYASTVYQLGALQGFLNIEGAALQHVKPHGAMHGQIHEQVDAGEAFCEAVSQLYPGTRLMVLAGPAGEQLAQQAQAAGLRVAREAFPERAYTADGKLASRQLPGSSIHDPQQAAQRALAMARGEVVSLEGQLVALKVDTLCIHGDNPVAVDIARAIHEAFDAAGLTLSRLGASRLGLDA